MGSSRECLVIDDLMTSNFARRMAELDAILERCRGRGPFAIGTMRDTSNRSNRDWPWWSIEVAHTAIDGAEKRRVTATVTLKSTQAGEVDSFEAGWRAEIWTGVSPDSFDEEGSWPLDWVLPTPEMLQGTVRALLEAGETAIAQATAAMRRA
jgi:hypothetical protein